METPKTEVIILFAKCFMESIVKCIETGLNMPQIQHQKIQKPLNCVIGDLKAITEQFVSLLNTSQKKAV